MKLFLWLLGSVLFPTALLAGMQSTPALPGRPTKDYKTIVNDLNQVTFVVITYYDGSAAIVADDQWLEPFKRLLATAEGKPANYCFCINYPQITLLTRDQKLATLETAHGSKLRFSGPLFSGDFQVDEKTVKAIDTLAMSQRANAKPPSRKATAKPEPPQRIEIKP